MILVVLLKNQALRRFQSLEAHDPKKAEQALAATFEARLFEYRARDGFYLRSNYRLSKTIRINHTFYRGFDATVGFAGVAFVKQQICLSGSAEARFGKRAQPLTPAQSCLIPAGAELETRFSPQFSQFGLAIDSNALGDKLCHLLGAAPGQALEFQPFCRLDTPQGAGIKRSVEFFVDALDNDFMSRSPVALIELEQMMLLSFLIYNRSNYSPMLEAPPPQATSRQLKRAEDYIEAHWSEPLTIEKLCQATSLSARTIYCHFKAMRGQSPKEFLKDVRLRHARDMLERAEGAASVTQTALACGFGNMGHFARDYFRRFGERPSDTLKKKRLQDG